ncbi:MAG: hypothetical protein ACYDEC_08190 [Bacteroidia bacterium]
MNTHPITHHTSNKNRAASADFEEALYDSMLRYSLRHLALYRACFLSKYRRYPAKSLAGLPLGGY